MIFTFNVYLLTVTEKLLHYSGKIWFLLKDSTQFGPLFSIRIPQILMLKPKSVNLYIKVNTHVHQDLQRLF